MDSAPYLQAEDKLDYERILEELLHNDQVRSALRRAPTGPNAEQLHTRAMRDFNTVSAEAAEEYTYFVELREQARRTTPVPDWERLGGDDPAQWQEPESPLVAAERAGWMALIAVLLPILSGLSALVLLLLGYGLRADSVALGQPLVTAGLVAAVVCAASIAVDIIGLLLTAARDAAAPPEGRNPELYAELAKARDTWHSALRDRGLLPYLLAQLGTVPRPPGPRPSGVSLVRTRPRLGFTSPGFTSPGPERLTNERGEEMAEGERATFHTSEPGYPDLGPERLTNGLGEDKGPSGGEPHFTSPGYSHLGPERLTNERGEDVEPSEETEPHFSSPGYSSPEFASPAFGGPRQAPDAPAAPKPPPAPVPPPRNHSRFLPNADEADGSAGADVEEGQR